MFLIDTNVVSEARRGSAEATAWLRSVDPALIRLSIVTLGEIAEGAALKRRTDPRAADALTAWLAGLRSLYADRVLPVDLDVMLAWGQLQAQRTRPVLDGPIAVAALVHHAAVVTRNTADFEGTGVAIIDPWA